MIAAPVQCDVDGIPKGVALRKSTADGVDQQGSRFRAASFLSKCLLGVIDPGVSLDRSEKVVCALSLICNMKQALMEELLLYSNPEPAAANSLLILFVLEIKISTSSCRIEVIFKAID
jgi:hypothetical protein